MNISSLSGASRPDPAEMRAQMFKDTDADGNGSISKEELTQAIANRPPPPQGGKGPQGAGQPPDVDELFKKLDANGDGAITEEEQESGLKAMHEEHQARMGSLDFSGSSDKLQNLIDAVMKDDSADDTDSSSPTSSSTSSTSTTTDDLIKELIARLTQESQKTAGYSANGSTESTGSSVSLFRATV